MKNKIIATKLIKIDSAFEIKINNSNRNSNANIFFDDAIEGDFPNEIYNFKLAIQEYEFSKENKEMITTENMLKKMLPIKSFFEVYSNAKWIEPQLSDNRKEKIKATVAFAEKYNRFIHSNEIKTLSPQRLYTKLLQFNLEFYEMIGKRFENSIIGLRKKLKRTRY